MQTPLHRAHTAAAVVLVMVGLLVLPAIAAAATAPRLIVGFADDRATADQVGALQDAGVPTARARAASKQGVAPLDVAIVDVAAGQLDAVRRRLEARPDVRYVEVDHVAHAIGLQSQAADGAPADWAPNDTMRSQQWALDAIGAPAAWTISRGTGAVVAVLDTGVDYIHPDLVGRVDLGPDLVDSDNDPMDVQGHGTHVAGIVAAGADDEFGVVGLAPNARILAVRVLDADGAGNYSAVARGIVLAADRGADVINLSLGGPQPSELLREAMDYAAARGSIVVCASGNEGARQVAYPGRYDSCTSVGATMPDDSHAPFSNVGAGIDLTAPGAQVLSSTMGGAHDAWDGTSMAAPYVGGLAALLASEGLGRRDILAAMTGTATDLGAAGYDPTFGHGRIDAGAALAAAARAPRAGAADETAPTVVSITAGQLRRDVRTSWRTAWKVQSRTPFRRVGTTRIWGTVTWRQTRSTPTRRIVSSFRAVNGIVYRSVIVSVRTRTPVRAASVTAPIVVEASDDVAVDRVAVQVGGRMVGVDWSAADGWRVDAPCDAASIDVVAYVYDAADNRAVGRSNLRLAC